MNGMSLAGRPQPWQRTAVCVLAFAAFAACAVMARRPPCAACRVEELDLTDDDGIPVRGRLYLPDLPGRRPAVVVAHGYLANLAFMEVPWASDLAAMGAATVFVDRHGHGRSPGRGAAYLGDPNRPASPRDIAAALSFARSDARIDPTRVALLGHSDGAAATLVAASIDPQVRATVAISASVAPWQIVSHVTPRQLLLIYGEHDRYVLHDTDRRLIAAATRGLLDGPGTATMLAGFNARRLVRVPDAGHVDVLFSVATRDAAVTWLGEALRLAPAVGATPLRTVWVVGGALALLVGLATALPANTAAPPIAAARRRALLLVLAWPACLAAALSARHLLPPLPLQEGDTVLALLAGGAMAGALARLGGRSAPRSVASGRERPGPVRSILLGIVLAGLTVTALSLLLQHYYDAWPSQARSVATLAIAAPALPAFLAVAADLRDLPQSGRATVLLLLAGVTALLARALLERMAVFPAYLFSATLVFAAAPTCSPVAAMTFGALLFARAAAAVCALR